MQIAKKPIKTLARSTPIKPGGLHVGKKVTVDVTEAKPIEPDNCESPDDSGFQPECTQLEQTGQDSTTQSDEESSDDPELDFRLHVRSMLKDHGLNLVQSYFDIEKKRFQRDEPPTKKRKR